ncbi:hypothetical protein EV182_004325 [Spiromyces aspiralis]|uniref:Uncharacterized protein n=1 Tax=Spiromyces aspiralis TaxID=68401 RepID=A0ACC1HWQ0_9FUNG|nr:hypothetical protein EV182_004325 [Spiromyces aspiralis]
MRDHTNNPVNDPTGAAERFASRFGDGGVTSPSATVPAPDPANPEADPTAPYARVGRGYGENPQANLGRQQLQQQQAAAATNIYPGSQTVNPTASRGYSDFDDDINPAGSSARELQPTNDESSGRPGKQTVGNTATGPEKVTLPNAAQNKPMQVQQQQQSSLAGARDQLGQGTSHRRSSVGDKIKSFTKKAADKLHLHSSNH